MNYRVHQNSCSGAYHTKTILINQLTTTSEEAQLANRSISLIYLVKEQSGC
jgi:hypothetical protein